MTVFVFGDEILRFRHNGCGIARKCEVSCVEFDIKAWILTREKERRANVLSAFSIGRVMLIFQVFRYVLFKPLAAERAQGRLRLIVCAGRACV